MPPRVTSRRQFARLAQPSQKVRVGPFRIHYVESDESVDTVAVAYAVPKTVGNAVVRNRIRRQLRSVFDQQRAELVPGLYLIKCDIPAKDLSYDQLRDYVVEALKRSALRA